jgi:hypothetical protein
MMSILGAAARCKLLFRQPYRVFDSHSPEYCPLSTSPAAPTRTKKTLRTVTRIVGLR